MTAAELHRKLLYKGHTELSAFLDESSVNYSLYQFLREVKPAHQVNTSMVTILNEVYYLCIRGSRDLTPGDNFYERYVAEEKAWTGSSMTTELIFCVALLLLKMQKSLSYQLHTFMEIAFSHYGTGTFAKEMEKFLNQQETKDKLWESDFTPQPMPADKLPTYTEIRPKSFIEAVINEDKHSENPWRVLTSNYAQTHILDFLRCYHTIDDQRILLDRIQESARTEERIAMENFYSETRELIDMGEYLPKMLPKTAPDNDRSSELAIAYQQIELLKQQMTDLNQQYATRLSEQSAEYDRRLARMEAQYKANVEANKEKLLAEVPKTVDTEPSFTIAEMAAHAKAKFPRQGADALTSMFYKLSMKHGYTDEGTQQLIDEIIPAIEQRTPLHQTIDASGVSQFNNNPQNVINQPQPE